jgi:hypothetical protein
MDERISLVSPRANRLVRFELLKVPPRTALSTLPTGDDVEGARYDLSYLNYTLKGRTLAFTSTGTRWKMSNSRRTPNDVPQQSGAIDRI